MINFSPDKQLRVILPNTNRALAEVLKNATPQELTLLSKGKDLATILTTLLKKSAQDSTQNATLLNLLKNNPTLKELSSVTATLKDLQSLLAQDKKPLPLENVLKNFLSGIESMSEKELKTKMQNSGVFLESNIKSQTKPPQLQELFSNDLKAVLLKTQEELTNTTNPNRQEILKQVDKLLLQIDYYQLSSHLSNASSLYLPYTWDALEDGNITLKSTKESRFFCDIELTLKEYGELKLRLGLFEEKELSINITAESEALKKKIKEHLGELKKQLLLVGITPKEIHFPQESGKENLYENSDDDLAMGFEVKV